MTLQMFSLISSQSYAMTTQFLRYGQFSDNSVNYSGVNFFQRSGWQVGFFLDPKGPLNPLGHQRKIG